MGSIVKGVCKNCGYVTGKLYIGGGMMNFKTHDGFPVLDKVKKVIITMNLKEKEMIIKKNPNLIFYDNELLFDKNLRNREHYSNSDSYKLYKEGHLCPKCNQFRIGFSFRGMWD